MFLENGIYIPKYQEVSLEIMWHMVLSKIMLFPHVCKLYLSCSENFYLDAQSLVIRTTICYFYYVIITAYISAAQNIYHV